MTRLNYRWSVWALLRSQRVFFFFGFVIVFTQSLCAQEETLSFSKNARTHHGWSSTLLEKGVAHACLGKYKNLDSVFCNPSLVPLHKEPNLNFQILASNGFNTYQRVSGILEGRVTDDFSDLLSKEGKIIQIEGGASMYFLSPYVTARYVPAHFQYFSVLRNQANPDVELTMLMQDEFSIQAGVEVHENVLIGVQAVRVAQKYVQKKFRLFDLATEAGRDLLKPQLGSQIYATPAITFRQEKWWDARLSLVYSNILVTKTGEQGLAHGTHPDFAVSVSPPMGWGEFDAELAYRQLAQDESNSEKVRFGLSYRLGAMSLVSGLDAQGISGGMQFGFSSLSAGILYTTTSTPWKKSDFYAQTVYLQLGWRI